MGWAGPENYGCVVVCPPLPWHRIKKKKKWLPVECLGANHSGLRKVSRLLVAAAMVVMWGDLVLGLPGEEPRGARSLTAVKGEMTSMGIEDGKSLFTEIG